MPVWIRRSAQSRVSPVATEHSCHCQNRTEGAPTKETFICRYHSATTTATSTHQRGGRSEVFGDGAPLVSVLSLSFSFRLNQFLACCCFFAASFLCKTCWWGTKSCTQHHTPPPPTPAISPAFMLSGCSVQLAHQTLFFFLWDQNHFKCKWPK